MMSLEEQNFSFINKKIFDDWIYSIILTPDNIYLFIGCYNGCLYQFDILQHQRIIKKYDQIHQSFINSMAVTPDNEFLFTSDFEGYL